jgi:cysteinyl-tRNA synthetase
VLARYDGEAVRFFMLRTHYRSPFNFSDTSLNDARIALRRLYTALDGAGVSTALDQAGRSDGPAAQKMIDWEHPQAVAFRTAMNDDFNTPGATAVLFELAAEVNRSGSHADASLLKNLGATLGLLQQPPRRYLQTGHTLDEASIQARIQARNAAKQARDFVLADNIRQELLEQGIALQDSSHGTTWVQA